MSPALKGQVLSQRVIRGAAIYSMRKNDCFFLFVCLYFFCLHFLVDTQNKHMKLESKIIWDHFK